MSANCNHIVENNLWLRLTKQPSTIAIQALEAYIALSSLGTSAS